MTVTLLIGKALTIALGAALGLAVTALWQFIAAVLLTRQTVPAADNLTQTMDRLLGVYVLPALPGALVSGALLGWLLARRRRSPSPMATTLLGTAATAGNFLTLALLAALEPVTGAAPTRSLPEHLVSAGLTTVPLWIALAWVLRTLGGRAVRGVAFRFTLAVTVAALVATIAMFWPARVSLSTRLLEAARKGTGGELVLLRALGARTDARDAAGRTALMLLAAGGHPWLAQLLLWTGADPNARASDGTTALHAATSRVVRTLVVAGADMDARDGAGLTPLVAAAEFGRLDAVKALREAGARGDSRFNAALLDAARRGDAEAVRKYAYIAADLHVRDGSGRTPFMWAVERGDAEIIRILGDAAGYAGPPPAGDVAMVRDTARPAVAAVRPEPIPDAILDEHGTTRLMRAAARGELAEVQGLLAGHASLDARDRRSGFTPLHLACASGHSDVVVALIHAGATLEARSEHDTTPLMVAAQSGEVDVVKVLLRADADLGARTRTGMTAMALAAAWGQSKMVRFLAAVGAEVNEAEPAAAPLLAAVTSPNVDAPRRLETVKALLQAGADPSTRLRDGSTALAAAQRQGDRDVLKLLQEAAAHR